MPVAKGKTTSEASRRDLEWAVGQVSRLDWLPGYPDKAGAVLAISREWLKIVGEIPPHTYQEDVDVEINFPGVSRDKASQELLDAITGACERFPAPIVMRRLYYEVCEHEPADGVLPAELEVRS